MSKTVKKETEERKIIFTSKLVEENTRRINDGVILKRFENPWFENEEGIRRDGLTFEMTPDEVAEYVKCASDIQYFAEKYCKVKREDGSIGNIKLRDYQKEILELYKAPKSALLAARQAGKTINASITILHFITFNNDKNVLIGANIATTTIEILEKLRAIYKLLPFFLKVPIKYLSQKIIVSGNGCKVKTTATTKSASVGGTYDLIYIDELALVDENIAQKFYKSIQPTQASIKNARMIITSTPNGMNLFHKIFTEGEAGLNNFKTMRVYWYQVPGRFVSYVILNSHMLHQYNINNKYVYEYLNLLYGDKTSLEMTHSDEKHKDIINVTNNDKCTNDQVKKTIIILPNGEEIPLLKIAELSSWKEEAIKDVGGEDAFEQEYGLRFINGTRSLLSESIIQKLLENKKEYIFEKIDSLEKRLKFSYKDLLWVNDDNVFMPINRNSAKIIMSIDIAEGLGQDYSVINIFKVSKKSDEIIDLQKKTYKNMSDFFCLEQIGIYRSNIISVLQLSEIFYCLVFEYFNPDNVKVVLELNTYGSTFLAHLPHLFEGNNDYGSHVFFRYKHRADAMEEKIGLKVNDNKNLLVKGYQEMMEAKNFIITNEMNIKEITTFVKHTTSAGNVRYAGDSGTTDDMVMVLINASTVFSKFNFREMVEEYANATLDIMTLNRYRELLKLSVEYKEPVDYAGMIKAAKANKMIKQYNNQGYNSQNYYGIK